MRHPTLCALLLISAASGVFGQAAAFEVTTVRPSDPLATLGGGSLRGGRLELRNATLKTLLGTAYQVKPYQILGGPSWMGSAKFDIQGKAATEIKWDEAWRMLQAMLADRFQVQLHRETRELPVYQLEVAKNGLKTKSAAAPGGFRTARGLIQSSGTSMPILVTLLTGALGRPVLDRTGRDGLFEVKLQWVPDETQPNALDADVSGFDPGGPSIFSALEEQLGLRLESAKAPVEVLVIDRAEKPSEN